MKASDTRVQIVAGVLVLGLVGWLVLRWEADQPKEDGAQLRESVARAPRNAKPAYADEGREAPPEHPAPRASGAAAAQASADTGPDYPEHFHPITEQHELLAHERGVVQQLNDAMDRGDGLAMRPLITEYRNFHHDRPVLQAGYEIIADCLQNPGEGSQAAAERYYRQERASTLRRFVRRHCFENQFP